MSRRGTSLIEMLAVISLVLPVAGLAMGLAGNLQRWRAEGDGRMADLVCLQLRRDAAGGTAVSAGELFAGGKRWGVESGWLCRDGAQRLRVESASWTAAGTVVSVRLRPHLLPERILELEAKP
jgi:hypothetical protein